MSTNLKRYGFKEGLTSGIEIVRLSDLYQNHYKKLIKPHRTDFYHIIWFQEGNPNHLVDFQSVKISPDTILFLAKDVVQSFEENVSFEGMAILFTEDFFCKTPGDIKLLKTSILFNDLLAIPKIHVPELTSPIRKLFSQIQNEIGRKPDDFQLEILRNTLRNLLLQAERKRRQQGFKEIKRGADLDYLLEFKQLLQEKFISKKMVKEYAQEMHITEKRLSQATATILGKTPKQLITDRLLLEAKRHLAHSHLNVKEISFELGFEEPTNFIKFFRKYAGKTPLKFRESLEIQ